MLEVALVDDELDPFAPADGQKVPEGLTVEEDNAPLGPGKTAVRHYLRVPLGDAKDVQAALAPHKAWWTSVDKKLPAGRRFVFQRVHDKSKPGKFDMGSAIDEQQEEAKSLAAALSAKK